MPEQKCKRFSNSAMWVRLWFRVACIYHIAMGGRKFKERNFAFLLAPIIDTNCKISKNWVHIIHPPLLVHLLMTQNVLSNALVSESFMFHDHLNGISSFIKFTYELKVEGELPFLDVLVTRQHSGALTTTIYHKPTHTNRYLQFTSHHPRHHKLSVARSLRNSLNTHITDHTD